MERVILETHRDQMEGQKVAGQIEEIAAVVAVSDATENVFDHGVPILAAQPERAADPDVVVDVLGERRDDDALRHERFDDQMPRLASKASLHPHLRVVVPPQQRVADVERAVRPRGLGEVLDRLRNALISVDQEHVAGSDRRLQFLEIVVDEPPVVAGGCG